MRPMRIATRTSPLALAQAEIVRAALRSCGVVVEEDFASFDTEGDRRLSEPLAEIGGKGVFTRELEQALRAGRADIAVHSLKDLPVDLPEDLMLGAMLRREDPRDALVTRGGEGFDALSAGSRIGTSSPRRRAQILLLRPDLEVRDMRGNVGTRLRRLDEGDVEGLVMAHAGLLRAGYATRAGLVLDPDLMLPAPGQGIIALEVSRGNEDAIAAAGMVGDPGALRMATAERSLLFGLGGGCAVPVGALAVGDMDSIRLTAGVFSVDGGLSLRVSRTGHDPVELGQAVAAELIRSGAKRLLEATQ